MENNELDFSWATYKDPDKVSINNDAVNKVNSVVKVQSVKKPAPIVKPVTKQNLSFKSKNKKIVMTGMGILTASILVTTMLQLNYKDINSEKVLALANEVSNDVVTETTLAYEPTIKTSESTIPNIYESNNIQKVEPLEKNVEEINEEEVSEQNYKEVCINIPDAATKYLGEQNYNKVINNFKDLIDTYSNMYGVDPNVVASIIMVECPDYDINNDRNYYKIGLGQFDGRYFDNETFTAYNFITGEKDKYTVHVENLYQNPENQIKLLCMTIANSAKTYNYNVTAILENHNKGCGSVSNCLNKLKSDYGYSSKDKVLELVDQNEIIKNINQIGDPNYSYKVSYYINMCLEKNEFNNNSFITFKDADTLENKTYLFKTSSVQRS